MSRSMMWAERLMDVDPKGDLIPVLAESWDFAPDGLAITFHLRKGGLCYSRPLPLVDCEHRDINPIPGLSVAEGSCTPSAFQCNG